MGLVEDDRIVLWQHAAAGCDVREVERVVRDHQVGVGGPLAGHLGEAARDERAAAARAAVGADGELGPERLRGLDLELGPVTRLGRVEPRLHRLPGSAGAALRQEERLEALQLAPAEVVLAPFHDRHLELAPERRGGDRHVVSKELLLQRLRRGRDDHPLPRLEGRQQVREALADARPGLRNEVPAGGERTLDGRREGGLLRPRLELRQRLRERAAG